MVIEYCGHTYLHEKIYEECKKYTKWSASHEASKFSDELKFRLTTLSGASMDRWEYLEKTRYPSKPSEYWWTVPQEEDFPTIHKFMKSFPKYVNPVVSKLGINCEVPPHDHGPQHQWLFNMSINEPEGSKTVIGDTVIPYKPGDIYKLYVHNNHYVLNGNEIRYHVLFRGGRFTESNRSH